LTKGKRRSHRCEDQHKKKEQRDFNRRGTSSIVGGVAISSRGLYSVAKGGQKKGTETKKMSKQTGKKRKPTVHKMSLGKARWNYKRGKGGPPRKDKTKRLKGEKLMVKARHPRGEGGEKGVDTKGV